MKYKPELVNELLKYIESGNYVETACKAVGLDEATYYRWLKSKSDFCEAVKKAEAKAIARNLAIIQVAAKKNWQAAAWFLERKAYKDWGKKDLIGGIENEPIEIVIHRNNED